MRRSVSIGQTEPIRRGDLPSIAEGRRISERIGRELPAGQRKRRGRPHVDPRPHRAPWQPSEMTLDDLDRRATLLSAVRTARNRETCVLHSRALWAAYACLLPRVLERWQIHRDEVTQAVRREEVRPDHNRVGRATLWTVLA